MSRILLAALVSLVLAASTVAVSRDAAPVFPARLESYLSRTARLTSAERDRLAAGAPVTKLLDADEGKEVAVFGAIWINALMRGYVDLVNDIENFERGDGFKVTKRISARPKLEDFARLHLPEEDVADLRTWRLGDRKVKLGEKALQRFRTEIDWKGPNPKAAVDALMQRLTLEYVEGYLEGGNDRLAVYRDNSRPTFVAGEFREMTDRMPSSV